MTFFQPSSHDTDTSKDQPPSDAEGEVKDIVYLNDSQNSRLISQLTKPVFIRSKDGLSAYNPPVAVVVDHFIQSFFSLHALLSSPPAAQFYAHQAPLSEKRISHIFSIRGSTTTSLFTAAPLNDDVDVVIKFSSPPPLLIDQSYFRLFCQMIGIQVFELLEGRTSSVTLHNELMMSCSPHSLRLTDKIQGVFKSFFPFPDQSKCIYSFDGLFDPMRVRSGANLDITLLFRPDQRLRLFRPISPITSSSSSSSLKEEVSSYEPTWDLSGSQSFAHDALELIVPTTAGKINLSARASFRALFGLDINYISALFCSRSLVILDPKMHLGYRRILYEIAKGKVPFMETGQDLRESKKVIDILCAIEENPFSTVKPGLEPLLLFARSKAEDKNFAFHLFLNGYMTCYLLIEGLQKHPDQPIAAKEQIDRLTALLHTFEREFIHASWQELFPSWAQQIAQFESPAKIARQIAEIKAHVCHFPDNEIRLSLSQEVRIAGVMDKRHGFILTKSLTIEEFYLNLTQLKKQLPALFFTQFVDELLGPIATIHCDPQTKWLFLFMLRRLGQPTLSHSESSFILSHLETFLRTWIENIDVIKHLELEKLVILFFTEKNRHVLSQEKELSLLKFSTPLAQIKHKDHPLLLPTLIYYILCISKQQPFAAEFLEKESQKSKLGHLILDQLISAVEGMASQPTPTKDFLIYLPSLIGFMNQKMTRKIQLLLRFIMSDSEKIEMWQDKEKESFKTLLLACFERCQESFFIEMYTKTHQMLDLDPLPYLHKKPDLFIRLTPEDQSLQFIKILHSTSIDLLEAVCSLSPDTCMELLAQHISQDHQITEQVLHKLINGKNTRPLLITRSDWLYALAKRDEPLSHTIYQSLCTQLSEKECLEFTKRFQTLWRRPLLNYLLLLSAPNLIAILKQHSSYMFDAKEETIRHLSLGQFCILIQHLIGTEYPFEKHSHFSSFLLNIVKCSAQMVSHEDTATLIHRYLPFIKSNYPNEECILTLLEHIPEKHLSPESLAIKNTMMCSLHAEQVATADYIRWAVRQPLSDGILKQINQKITKKGFKNEEFSLLVDYFHHNPRLLRNLIKIGEAQNIEQNTLSRAIKVFFQGEKPLEEQLLLIEHMICKHYPENLTSELIHQISWPKIISKEQLSLLSRILTELTDENISLFETIIPLCISAGYPYQSTENFLMLFDRAVELGKTIQGEKGTNLINAIVAHPEMKNEIFFSSVIQNRARLVEYFALLNSCQINASYLSLLLFTLKCIDRQSASASKDLLLFSFIEREIVKINPLRKKESEQLPQDLFSQAKVCLRHFLINFLPQITQEHSAFLFLTWTAFAKEEIFSLLGPIDQIAAKLPENYLIDLFTFFIENNLKPRNQEDKEILKKCFQLLSSSSNNERCFAAALSYQALYPEDPSWPEHSYQLMHRACRTQDIHLILWIANLIPIGPCSKEWERKKREMTETFEKFILNTDSTNLETPLALIQVFDQKLNIDKSALFLHLLSQEVKKEFSESGLESIKTILMASKSLQIHFTISPLEKSTLQKGISIMLQQCSYPLFRHYLPYFLMGSFFTVFEPGIKKTFQKFTQELLEEIFLQPISDDLYENITLAGVYLIPIEGDDKMKDLIMTRLLRKIEQHLEHPEDTLIYHLCLTNLLGLYTCFVVKDVLDIKEPAITELCKRALPFVSSRHFTIRFDMVYLLSYARVIHLAEQPDLLLAFLIKIKEHIDQTPLGKTENALLFSLCTKTLIPALSITEVDYKTCHILSRLIIQTYQNQPLNSIERKIICSLFEKCTMSADLSQREIKEYDPVLMKRFIDLCDTITTASSSVNEYKLLIIGINRISGHKSNDRALIISIHNLCCKVIIHLKKHKVFEEGLLQISEMLKQTRPLINQSQLFDPLSLILYVIPSSLMNLERLRRIKNIQVNAEYNQSIKKIYVEFKSVLFQLIDRMPEESLDKKEKLPFYLEVIPIKGVEPFLSMFNIMLVDSTKEEDPFIVIKYCRIITSVVIFFDKLIQQAQIDLALSTDKGVIEYTLKEKENIKAILSKNMDMLCRAAPELPFITQQMIMQLILVGYDPLNKHHSERASDLARAIIKKTAKKKEIITSTLSYILDYLYVLYQASKLNAEVAHRIQQEAEALWTSFQKDPKISQDTKKAIIGKSGPAVIAFVTKEPAAAVETPAEEAAADTAEEEETAFGISDIIQSIVGILFN